MKPVLSYISIGLLVFFVFSGCKKKEPVNPVYQYYPMNLGNEWVYAINNVYGGLDTLHVKVIAIASLSSNKPCWQISNIDMAGLYNDTTYVYISSNKDTMLTYSNQNDSSLSEKWILADIAHNIWTGVDTSDKYYFEQPFDSMSAFYITYHNIWEIQRTYYHGIYSNVEQFYYEANVGLCSYNIDASTTNGPIEQEWHLISYQLH